MLCFPKKLILFENQKVRYKYFVPLLWKCVCDISCEMKVSAGVSLWASSPAMPLEFPLEKPPKRQH